MLLITEASNLVGVRLSDVERSLILATLAHCGGNRTQAARMLGVSLRTVRNKIKQYKEEPGWLEYGCAALEPQLD